MRETAGQLSVLSPPQHSLFSPGILRESGFWLSVQSDRISYTLLSKNTVDFYLTGRYGKSQDAEIVTPLPHFSAQ